MFDEMADQWEEIAEARDSELLIQRFDSLERSAPPGSVLDLGCGQGRLLPRLADSGRNVIGLDISRPLLEKAQSYCAKSPQIRLLEGDMRHLSDVLPGRTLAVTLRSYTSLGYFDEKQELGVAEGVLEHSVRGGLLIVDSFNSDWFAATATIERCTPLSTFDLVERYSYRQASNTIACSWVYRYPDGAERTIEFTLDGYDTVKVKTMLNRAGWTHVDVLSGYTDRVLSKEVAPPERIVAVART